MQEQQQREAITLAAKRLSRAMKKELTLQGHVASGSLKKSIEPEPIREGATFYETLITMLAYGKDVDEGVPANKVPSTKEHFSKIFAWLKTKKLTTGNEKEDVRFALAIVRNHKRNGIPSKSSARFSKTGKRTGFIQDALNKHEDDVVEKLADDIYRSFKRILQ